MKKNNKVSVWDEIASLLVGMGTIVSMFLVLIASVVFPKTIGALFVLFMSYLLGVYIREG